MRGEILAVLQDIELSPLKKAAVDTKNARDRVSDDSVGVQKIPQYLLSDQEQTFELLKRLKDALVAAPFSLTEDQQAHALLKLCTKVDEFEEWIVAVSNLLISIPKVPAEFGECAKRSGPLEMILVFAGRLNGDRNSVYQCEYEILRQLPPIVDDFTQLTDAHVLPLQKKLTRLLLDPLESVVTTFASVTGKKKNALFTSLLALNEHHVEIQTRLSRAVDDFQKLHQSAKWSDGRTMFASADPTQLEEATEIFPQRIAKGSFEKVWRQLFEHCVALDKCLADEGSMINVPDGDTPDWRKLHKEIGKEAATSLKVLHQLRNRAAHTRILKKDNREKILNGWRTSQDYAARVLGRKWRWSRDSEDRESVFDTRTDLHLSKLEAMILKLRLVTDINEALMRLSGD